MVTKLLLAGGHTNVKTAQKADISAETLRFDTSTH